MTRPSPSNKRRRKSIIGARMGNDADPLEKPTLFEHRTRSPHHTAHDRIVALGERIGTPARKSPRTSGPSSSKRGPSTSLAASRGVVANVAKHCDARPRAAADCGTGPIGSFRSAAKAVHRSGTESNSSRIHSPPSKGVPSTCGAPWLSAARRSHNSTASSWIGVAVPRITFCALRATVVKEIQQIVRSSSADRAPAYLATRAPCAPHRGSRHRTTSWPARRVRLRRRR